MPSIRTVVYCILVVTFALPVSAKTWFVRTDGGTRYSQRVQTGQCDGKADAAYPGKGVNQHCAYNDVRYMWLDGTYGNSQWVMAGGDTLVIRGCKALHTQQNPDAPHCRIGWDKAAGNDADNFWCAGVDGYCSMPPPPSGTTAQHTRILGDCAFGSYACNPVNEYPYLKNNLTQLFGGFGVGAVMYLSGSKYVDVEGLEITSHNGKCTRVGYPQYPRGCSTDRPVSDFASWGIITTNTTSDIMLQDVYIHGFTNMGIGGPIGGPFTLTRVSINFNAFAGWNFDDGHSTPNAPGSSITQSHVTMIGNGCLEEYPIVHPQFPAKACWDSSSGGFGDAWSGQDTALDSFTCDHCNISYNTKDAALGPHTRLKNLSITNSMAIGNMGQQHKWGMQPNSTALIANNLIVGNCYRMSEQLPGAAQSFNSATKLPGAYLSNYCRAAGDVFSFFSDANSSVRIVHNTVIAESATVFDLSCAPLAKPGACASTPYNFINNIYLGYTNPSYPAFNGQAPGLYYKGDPRLVIASSRNVEYGVRNGDTCGANGNLCADPMLQNEPRPQKRMSETFLDTISVHPSANSPVVGKGRAVGIPVDFFGRPRPVAPSIGAAEPKSSEQ